jgi:hypothetical protein
MLGGGTVLDNCQNGAGAFTQRASGPGRWRALPGSELTRFCDHYDEDESSECSAVALGSQWIQVQGTCYHCAIANRLASIADGRAIADPTRGRVIADLNAADPARRRCAHVTAHADGSVQFLGDLALVANTQLSYGSSYRIKRCNTTKALNLPATSSPIGTRFGQVATNASLILWPGGNGLAGIQARTDRRFSIKLPKGAGGTELAISSNTIYVGDESGYVWTARLPAALRTPARGS